MLILLKKTLLLWINNYICFSNYFPDMKNYLWITILLLFFVSCISTKKRTYFQGELAEQTISDISSKEYRIQVDDVLQIEIKANNPDIVKLFSKQQVSVPNQNITADLLYFQGYSVDTHGNIRLPYIGEMNVLGYTEKEIIDKVETGLAGFIKDMNGVFVSVKLAGVRILVLGEVNSPGTVNLYQNRVSIIDAIANAGEVKVTGNRENIILIRKTPAGTEKFSLNITDMDVFNDDNFYIEPNDIVYVPPLKQKAFGTGENGFQTLTTTLSLITLVVSTVLIFKSL